MKNEILTSFNNTVECRRSIPLVFDTIKFEVGERKQAAQATRIDILYVVYPDKSMQCIGPTHPGLRMRFKEEFYGGDGQISQRG